MAEPNVKSIVTKDGIEITGIPIDMPKDDPRLKTQVAQMRAAGIKSGTFAGTKPTGDMAKEASALEAASRQTQPQAGQTAFSGKQTPGELAGQIISEIPQNAGIAARGLVKGAMSIPTMVMDPVTAFMNKYLPPEWQQLPPSEGITLMFKSLGVKEPETRALEVLESLTMGLGSSAAGLGIGAALGAGAPVLGMGTKAQGVGQVLAAQPAADLAGSAAAMGAGKIAEQQGASPLTQAAIGLGAGVAGSRIASPPTAIKTAVKQSDEGIGEIIRKAASGDKIAKKTVADLAAINPEARAAARRLEIELPADVFTDNEQVRAAAGLGRSVAGSTEEAAWRGTVKNAVERADKILEDYGSTFIEGTPAPAVASARVKDSLLAAKKELKDQYTKIYDEIDAAVPKSTPAVFDSTKAKLAEIALEVGEDGMSAQEKRLAEMVSKSKNINFIPEQKIPPKELSSIMQDIDSYGPLADDDQYKRQALNDIRNRLKKKGIEHIDAYHVTDAPENIIKKEGLKGSALDYTGRSQGNLRESSVYMFLDPDDMRKGDPGILGATKPTHNVVHIKIPLSELEKMRWDSNYNITYDTYSANRIIKNIPPEWISGIYKYDPSIPITKTISSSIENAPTYGRLIREKNLMGQAIAKKDSPYGNMEAGALKRLYGALSEDQLASVEQIGSPELMEQLVSANLMYGKDREIGKKIVDLFGKDFAGSISDKMKMAITSSAKGNTGAFTRLMESVPDELKKEVTATALASVARSGAGATKGQFGFSEFTKVYDGIRANPEVYKQIVKNLGTESDAVLRDLYEVSKRITEARANVLTTGKANQALLQGLTAQNLVEKTLSSVLGKGVVSASGAATGGLMGGGVFGASVGAGISNAIADSLSRGEKSKLEAVGKLFRSKDFQDLIVKAGTTDAITPEQAKALASSAAFKSFAKAVKLPVATEQLDTWILSAAAAKTADMTNEEAAAQRKLAEER